MKITKEFIIKSLKNIDKMLDIADSISLECINKNHEIKGKGDRDYALEVDLNIEKTIKSELSRLTPNIPILGEETDWNDDDLGNNLFWVIDPIDGTINYSRQLPLYATNIALIHNERAIGAGISFPLLKERYIAGKELGALLNGKKLSISQVNKVQDSIVGFGDFAVGNNSSEKNDIRYKLIAILSDNVLRVRMLGTAALQLAWLAAGKIDISLTLSNNSWDVQSGVLLVREAGGVVYDFNGKEHLTSSKYTLASNAHLKKYVLESIQNIEKPNKKIQRTQKNAPLI